MNEWARLPTKIGTKSDIYRHIPATSDRRSGDVDAGMQSEAAHLDPVCSAADLSPYCLDAFHFAVDDLGAGDALDAFLIEVRPVLRAWARTR